MGQIIDDPRPLDRVLTAPSFGRGPMETWPKVRVWTTERGQVAVVDHHDSVVVLADERWDIKPTYVKTLLADLYGCPTVLTGQQAFAYLAERFKP